MMNNDTKEREDILKVARTLNLVLVVMVRAIKMESKVLELNI